MPAATFSIPSAQSVRMPSARRGPLDLVLGGTAGGEARDRLGHLEQLEDADAALEAGVAAAGAADLAPELDPREAVRGPRGGTRAASSSSSVGR